MKLATSGKQKTVSFLREQKGDLDRKVNLIELKVPRWLEYEAFLSYSTLMSGGVKKGVELAKKTYKKFLSSKEGRKLKRDDYPTWAVWITGIPIRTVGGLLDSKEKFNRKEMEVWLSEAAKFIKKPATSKRWARKIDFQFRKDELRKLEEGLGSFKAL